MAIAPFEVIQGH